MSAAFTEVIAGGEPVLGIHGHESYADAVKQARDECMRQITAAVAALDAIDRGDVQVFHQRGIHVAKGRREVHGEPT
jgi:hypothetical protein